MEDDYLPLYEVVDHQQNKDQSNKAAGNIGYEKLIVKDDDSANGEQEEYQLPLSDSRYVHYEAYSEIATEINTLKRNSRHLKTVFSIGGIIMFILLIITVCILTAMCIRFGRNLTHVQKSLADKADNQQGQWNTKSSFQNCSQETAVCNFINSPSGSGTWLYCDTTKLRLHTAVS